MKHISKLTKEDIKDIKLIVFDVDGVLVPRGTKISTDGDTLTLQIKKIHPRLIQKIKKLTDKGFQVNISSGRSLFMLQEMFRPILDYVSITYENGSATFVNGTICQHVNSYDKLKGITEELITNTNKFVKGFEPKEFIVTIHCEDRLSMIEYIAAKHKELYCMWNGEAYDIGMYHYQTKGVGIQQVAILSELQRKNILAIGDNYNDIELLDEAGVKITADKSRLKGDFYIELEGKKLPGEVLIDKILEEAEWEL